MNTPITLHDVKRLAEGQVADLEECDRIFDAMEQSPELMLAYDSFLSTDDAQEPAEAAVESTAAPVDPKSQADFVDFLGKLRHSRLLPVVGIDYAASERASNQTSQQTKVCDLQIPGRKKPVSLWIESTSESAVRVVLGADVHIEPVGLLVVTPAFVDSMTKQMTSVQVVNPKSEQYFRSARGLDAKLAAHSAAPRSLAADDRRTRNGLFQINEPDPAHNPGSYLISIPHRQEVEVDWVVVEWDYGEYQIARNLFLSSESGSQADSPTLREATVVRPADHVGLKTVMVRPPTAADLAQLDASEVTTLLGNRMFTAMPVNRISENEFEVSPDAALRSWLVEADDTNRVVCLRAQVTEVV